MRIVLDLGGPSETYWYCVEERCDADEVIHVDPTMEQSGVRYIRGVKHVAVKTSIQEFLAHYVGPRPSKVILNRVLHELPRSDIIDIAESLKLLAPEEIIIIDETRDYRVFKFVDVLTHGDYDDLELPTYKATIEILDLDDEYEWVQIQYTLRINKDTIPCRDYYAKEFPEVCENDR